MRPLRIRRTPVAERVHPVVKRTLEHPIISRGEGAGVGSDERVRSRGQYGSARPGAGSRRGSRRSRGDVRARRRCAPTRRTGRGSPTRPAPRSPRTGASGRHPARAGAVEHRAASGRHAATARSGRVGGRGAGGLEPRLPRLPPLPDAGAVRTALRAIAGHRRTRRRRVASQGLTVGTPSTTGLSLPVSGTVAQIQSAFSTPIDRYRLVVGQDGVRQQVGAPGARVGGPADRGHPRTEHAQPAPAVDDRPAGEPRRRRTPGRSAAAPALAPGQPSPQSGNVRHATSAPSRPRTARSMPSSWRRRTRSIRSTPPNHYGAGTTVALLEMSGAGYRSSDISHLRRLLRHHARRRRRSRRRHRTAAAPPAAPPSRRSSTSRPCSPWRPRRTSRSTRAAVGQHLQRLQSDRQRRHGEDRERQLDERLRGLRAAVVPELGEHARSRRRRPRGSRSSSPRVIRVRRAATSTVPSPRTTGSAIRWPRPSTPRRAPSTSPTSRATRSASTARAAPTRRTSARPLRCRPGPGPDAVALALDSVGKGVRRQRRRSTLTVFSTSTCNQTTTSGCGSPTQIASGGHLAAPAALAANGSTLYVGNSATARSRCTTRRRTPTWRRSPSVLVDPDRPRRRRHQRLRLRRRRHQQPDRVLQRATCNAHDHDGCSATPTTVSVGNTPVALAVASSAGDLYVANAGSGGGISVVSLSTHAVVKTISTSQPSNGTGLVQSIGMSPDNNEVLAVLDRPGLPRGRHGDDQHVDAGDLLDGRPGDRLGRHGASW